MKHFQITIEPIETQWITAPRFAKTSEVVAIDRIAAEQKALDAYGDWSRVTKCVEFDPDYPPVYRHEEDEDKELA